MFGCVRVFVFLSLLPAWCLASRVTGTEKTEGNSNSLDHVDGAHLCVPAVVQEECLLLSGDPTTMTSDDLKQALASADAAVTGFWNSVLPDSHPGSPVTCQKLCLSTVAFVGKHMPLPPAIDTGCYNADGQVVCDLDLSVNALEGRLQMRRQVVPDMQEPKKTFVKQIKDYKSISKQFADGVRPVAYRRHEIEYGVWETAVRVANLFRIYPLPSFSFGDFGDAPPMLPAAEGLINGSATGSSFLEDTGFGCPPTCFSERDCSRYPYTCGKCKMCTRQSPTQPASNTAMCFGESMCSTRCSSLPMQCGGCRACQGSPGKACRSFCSHAGYCSRYPYQCGGCGFCQPITTTTTTTTRPTVISKGRCDPQCLHARTSIGPEKLCSEYSSICGGCKMCARFSAPACDERCVPMAGSVGVETVCPAYPEECGGCDICTSLPKQHRNWRVEVQQRSQEAQTYINTAIRKFRRKATKEQITRWFGSEAFNDDKSRHEVMRTLNSVDRMLGNVHYVYPGKNCDFGVYAYVFPKGGPEEGDEDTMTGDGQYIFYLCPLYVYSSPSVQVETLTHEGSHHATAFTDDVCMDEYFDNGTVQPQLEVLARDEAPEDVQVGDYLVMEGEQGEEIIIVVRFVTQSEVIIQIDPPMGDCKNKAYGRESCEALAKGMSWKALRNADNFCYYVQDITDDS